MLTQPRARPPSAQLCPCQTLLSTLNYKLGRDFSHLKKPETLPRQEMCRWDKPATGNKCLKIKVIKPKKCVKPDGYLGKKMHFFHEMVGFDPPKLHFYIAPLCGDRCALMAGVSSPRNSPNAKICFPPQGGESQPLPSPPVPSPKSLASP